MGGPVSPFDPVFPDDFTEEARIAVRRRTAAHQSVQRYRLVLLLSDNARIGNEEAGRQVGLSRRQVIRWRKRRSSGDFSVGDIPGRGRRPLFSPSGSRNYQSGSLRTGLGDGRTSEPPVII